MSIDVISIEIEHTATLLQTLIDQRPAIGDRFTAFHEAEIRMAQNRLDDLLEVMNDTRSCPGATFADLPVDGFQLA